MADFKVREATNSWSMKRFVELPYSLYKNNKYWEYPIKSAQWDLFNTTKEHYLKDNKVKFFYIKKGFKTLGRIAAFVDNFINRNNTVGNLTGFWGFFESVDDQEVASSLIETAENYLREKGCTKSVGPMSYSTLHNFGLLVQGFEYPARVYTQYNLPYYENLITSCGYSELKELHSYNLSREESEKQISEDENILEKRLNALARIYSRKDIYLRPVNIQKPREESLLMADIYNDAFSETWGFIPLSEQKSYSFFQEFKDVADPNFIPVAFYKGKPAGFCLTLPDVNVAFRKAEGCLLPFGFINLLTGLSKIDSLRIAILGVRKKFQSTPISYCLIMDVMRKFFASKYKNIEVSLVFSDNKSHTKIPESFGAELIKVWKIYEKEL